MPRASDQYFYRDAGLGTWDTTEGAVRDATSAGRQAVADARAAQERATASLAASGGGPMALQSASEGVAGARQMASGADALARQQDLMLRRRALGAIHAGRMGEQMGVERADTAMMLASLGAQYDAAAQRQAMLYGGIGGAVSGGMSALGSVLGGAARGGGPSSQPGGIGPASQRADGSWYATNPYSDARMKEPTQQPVALRESETLSAILAGLGRLGERLDAVERGRRGK